jgi:YVTN family beta-propeller protein
MHRQKSSTPLFVPFSSAAAIAVLIAAPMLAQTDPPRSTVGHQDNGSIVLPSNQVITPLGIQIDLPLARPNVVAVRPDGQTAAFLAATVATPIRIANLVTGKEVQEFLPGTDRSMSYDGLLYSADGKHLYASQDDGRVTIMNVSDNGMVTLGAQVAIPQPNGSSNPGGLALSADGKTLYVVLNRYNALGIIDLTSNTFVDQIPVENSPRAVALVGQDAYVSNEGGHVATSADFTIPSSGTPIGVNPQTGAASSGTVSVVDLTRKIVVASIPVGLHPTAILSSGNFVFVANTNSDSISVIEAALNKVVSTVSVAPFPGAPFGSSPNSLAMTNQQQLVVTLGTNNALGIFQWNAKRHDADFLGLVPTGWYPGSVAVDPVHDRLLVANVKGEGSLGAPQVIGDKTGPSVYGALGTASLIRIPGPDRLPFETYKVYRNNRWDKIDHQDIFADGKQKDSVVPVAIPRHLGDPSLIKHVFLVVKENRTYDQVFGDDARANGDASFVDFGIGITPNHHALAKQFSLLDNFYGPSINSADGHQWVVQAIAPDYIEKAETDTVRSYPFNGGDSLVYTESGFLWRNALAHKKTVRDYGEYLDVPVFNIPEAQLGTWSDFYQDALILEGAVSGNLHVPVGSFQSTTLIPSLEPIANKDFPQFTGTIPDQYRADVFLSDFKSYVQNGDLPNLIIMTLPDDHTNGTSPGLPTPQAAVADNDLALGRVVDAISHSPYWSSSAIFVEEDDEQDGVDHVDGHRNPGMVISPFARHGKVVDEYYTQVNVDRTIEQIFGLPPMNQFDLAASPMFSAFTDTLDRTPYTFLQNNVPLNDLNPQTSALNGVRRAWAQASLKMFAGNRYKPDAENPALLNRAIWYASTDFKKPYPGDPKVYLPKEVPKNRGWVADRD